MEINFSFPLKIIHRGFVCENAAEADTVFTSLKRRIMNKKHKKKFPQKTVGIFSFFMYVLLSKMNTKPRGDCMLKNINPQLQVYFECLPIHIKNHILELKRPINSLNELLSCVELIEKQEKRWDDPQHGR
ncbi:hypothetical protein H8705_10970 [Oscillospiraceae bacterium NSJ-64]|uniref:Uncharacterized protein n=2 Tax=Youxingia wuxianensis TaxID=2763678 RepID=A0A926ETK7_9FIRM|nr:hypothetical protein [Youxingia wuxianensis]